MGGRLGAGVERIERCFAIRPRPLRQHVDRIDQRRPEQGEFLLDAGRHFGVGVAFDEVRAPQRLSVWVSILREMPPINSISLPWHTGPCGGETVERSLDVLCPGGHLVTVAAEESSELAAKYDAAGMRFNGIAVDPDPVALRGLVELGIQGRLRIHVHQTFPLERVADAHRLLDSGHLQGKLVLTV